MKKKIIFLIILGIALYFMPEFLIVAGITTKTIGFGLLAAVGLGTFVYWMYRFQCHCDRVVREMREEQAKRMLEERNTVLFYPSAKALKAFGKYLLTKLLPRMFMAVFACVMLYLAVALSWPYIQPILKYISYAMGIIFIIILIICIIPVKSVDTGEWV